MTIDWNNVLSLRATREELGLSQVKMATLLGVSPRTVQSCEQGWRKLSPALQKSLLLLRVAHRQAGSLSKQACWSVVGCSKEAREDCMAYRTRQGHLCWLVAGNMYRGKVIRSWQEKKPVCGDCPFLIALLDNSQPRERAARSRS